MKSRIIISFITLLFLVINVYGKSVYKKTPESDKLVILIHGIADSQQHMWRIQKESLNAGYSVLNFDYESTKMNMQSIISSLQIQIDSVSSGYNEINFIVHSLGSLVLRAYLAQYYWENYGSAVLIAPPSQGSIIAERFEDTIPFQIIFGEAGQKLGKDRDDYWRQFPPPSIPFGIIAGGIGSKHGLNPLIPGDDDGTVGVEETRIEGYLDFIVLPGLHSTLLWQNEVIDQSLYFLRNKRFNSIKTKI
jgi:pimeloyl-ACP methyl ester carboxylesterase